MAAYSAAAAPPEVMELTKPAARPLANHPNIRQRAPQPACISGRSSSLSPLSSSPASPLLLSLSRASSGKPARRGVVAREMLFCGTEYGHHGPHPSTPKLGPPTSSSLSSSSSCRRRGRLALYQQRRVPDGVHLAVGGDGEPRTHVVEERV
uniref:Uncharacterized protein n=1 Tax=Oryza sativa subsp. japonica TaxID=39947 RepID=Q84ZQ6_ORYSJ|nr:hypothetical protein [Oryza sativa Japonica Group]